MRLINKEMITRVVDELYPSKYKIFTINSEDGINIVKPIGLFVSLGITTSMSTIQMICKKINSSLNISSYVSEIESRMVSGVYVNKITKTEDVSQYDSGILSNGTLIDKNQLLGMIRDVKDKMITSKDDDEFMKYNNILYKLSKISRKMKSSESFSSGNYSVIVSDNNDRFNASLVNNKINYMQYNEINNGINIIVHKRIGILIKF